MTYFAIVVVAETAQTGTPFGKRFNSLWAPLRLVMAFGLLIPISYGLNSGQYIVLYAAKYGANFATNGWIATPDLFDPVGVIY
jgi:conjugal transfer/type IV secretion protein DotA/TraY